MPSIEEHCCGADQLFDKKTAEKQYRQYQKKGASRVSAKIIDQMASLERGERLLDVGGGIGSIQWWFLQNGGMESISVDASHAYTEIAKTHALEQGWQENTEFLIGDLVDFKDQIPNVDHSSLDKVICCYPDYRSLLTLIATKTQKSIHLSYPMDGLIAQAFRGLGVLFMKAKGSAFRPYVHPVKEVRSFLIELGFENQKRGLAFPWYVESWVRKPKTEDGRRKTEDGRRKTED